MKEIANEVKVERQKEPARHPRRFDEVRRAFDACGRRKKCKARL